MPNNSYAWLRSAHTIAIVGCSPKPQRDSYDVARYLQAAGYRILPVNPVAAGSGQAHILGERCYASLAEATQLLDEASQSLGLGQRIDIVVIFRNSADVPPVVNEAIAVHAGAVWMQLGHCAPARSGAGSSSRAARGAKPLYQN